MVESVPGMLVDDLPGTVTVTESVLLGLDLPVVRFVLRTEPPPVPLSTAGFPPRVERVPWIAVFTEYSVPVPHPLH